jgi:hypothetical protein
MYKGASQSATRAQDIATTRGAMKVGDLTLSFDEELENLRQRLVAVRMEFRNAPTGSAFRTQRGIEAGRLEREIKKLKRKMEGPRRHEVNWRAANNFLVDLLRAEFGADRAVELWLKVQADYCARYRITLAEFDAHKVGGAR